MQTVNALIDKGLVWRSECATPEEKTVGELCDFFPRGRVHEFFCNQKGDRPALSVPLILVRDSLLKERACSAWGKMKRSNFFVFIGREVFPTPFFIRDCFFGKGSLSLKDFIFLDVKNDREKIWAIETAVSSPSVACVLVECNKVSFPVSRKISLLAKKSGATCLILHGDPDGNTKSAAFSRWKIRSGLSEAIESRWNVSLTHTKGSKTKVTSWSIEVKNEEEISVDIFPELVSEFGAERPAHRQVA